MKKTFEIFGLNYDAVFEDGSQIIFLHIYNKALFFQRFVEKSKPYKVYYTLQERQFICLKHIYTYSLLL